MVDAEDKNHVIRKTISEDALQVHQRYLTVPVVADTTPHIRKSRQQLRALAKLIFQSLGQADVAVSGKEPEPLHIGSGTR